MKRLQLEDDGHCFACGKKNPGGLQLDFTSSNGKTAAEFLPKKEHQGFKDLVHGGIIATILDEAMVKAVLSTGVQAVTAELKSISAPIKRSSVSFKEVCSLISGKRVPVS